MYQSISSLEHLFFSFSWNFFIYQLDFLFLWPVWALHSFESFVSYLSSCCFGVSVFVLFQMLWMLVNVNKAKFSLQNILIAFWQNPGLRVPMLVTMYNIMFTPWNILITFVHSLKCPLLSTIIIFSKAHAMSCFHTQNFRLVLVFFK